MRVDEIPTVCSCGCGLPINEKVVVVVRLRQSGYSVREAAKRAGVSYATAKMAGRQFSRWRPGHRRSGPWETRTCRYCNRQFKTPSTSARQRCRNCPALSGPEWLRLNCAEYDAREAAKNTRLREQRFALFGGRAPKAVGTPHWLVEQRKALGSWFLSEATEPALTPEQERLVGENLRLVPWVMRKYAFHLRAPAHLDEDDLIAYGRMGLMRAAISFDPERAKFSTYAVPKIRSAMQTPLNEAAAKKRGGAGRGGHVFATTASIEALHEDVGYDVPVYDSHDEFEDSDLVAEVLARAAEIDPRLPEILRRRMDGETDKAIGASLGLSQQRIKQIGMLAKTLVAGS